MLLATLEFLPGLATKPPWTDTHTHNCEQKVILARGKEEEEEEEEEWIRFSSSLFPNPWLRSTVSFSLLLFPLSLSSPFQCAMMMPKMSLLFFRPFRDGRNPLPLSLFFCTHMINYCKTELTTSSKVVSIPSQGKCHFSPSSPLLPSGAEHFFKDPIREITLTLLSLLQLAKASFVRRTKIAFQGQGRTARKKRTNSHELAKI